MELKEFISDTISQISEGIIDAKTKCKKYGVIINPNVTIGSDGNFSIPKHPEHVTISRRVQLLDMDIAITVQDSTENGANGKIGVSMLGIGGGIKNSNANSQQSRIRFSIPVCFPSTDVLTTTSTLLHNEK